VFERKDSLVTNFLVALSTILVVVNAFCYGDSALIARIILIITFLILLSTMSLCGFSNNYSTRIKVVAIILMLSSVFFLIWRSSLFTPRFIEMELNSETILLSHKYATSNHLVFDSAHSYFFLQPVILHCLCSIGGFSSVIAIYVSLFIFGALAGLVGILVYKTLLRYLPTDKRHLPLNLIFPLIAFLMISFAFSERSGKATNFSLMLTLMTLWFLAAKEFRNREESIVLLLLVAGITIGDTNGTLILIPFFLLYPIFARKGTIIVNALIPLSYLMFSAYSYTLRLQKYATFAINGFIESLEEIMLGQLPERVIPWRRTISRTYEDTVICSVAYLSLFALSFVVAIISLHIWLKVRKNTIKDKDDARSQAFLICLLLWLSIAAITYIGASFRPETPSSDIRTITIVLTSLPLPFLLMSKRLISYIESRKVLLFCLMTLMILASMRTVYEVHPKSIQDTIYVVEDSRLGLTSIYILADFLNEHYQTGGIVGDYKIFNRIGKFLPDSQYEKRWLNESTLSKPFTRFPYKSILVFSVAGTTYPSVYHSPEAYMAAYNFSLSHNRLYDNGIVVMASQTIGKP